MNKFPPRCCDLNSDCWCIVNENLSFFFILQQMETGTKLIIFHKHDISENCDIKKSISAVQ